MPRAYTKYIHFHAEITLKSKELLRVGNQRRNARKSSKEVGCCAQQELCTAVP